MSSGESTSVSSLTGSKSMRLPFVLAGVSAVAYFHPSGRMMLGLTKTLREFVSA